MVDGRGKGWEGIEKRREEGGEDRGGFKSRREGRNRRGEVGRRRGGRKRGKGRRREGKEGKREEGEEDDLVMGFWNVAGLRNKDREFWRRLGD